MIILCVCLNNHRVYPHYAQPPPKSPGYEATIQSICTLSPGPSTHNIGICLETRPLHTSTMHHVGIGLGMGLLSRLIVGNSTYDLWLQSILHIKSAYAY